MVLVFGSPSEEFGYRQSLLFVLLLLPVLAGTTYLLLYVLVPRYLLKRRFFLFGLYSCYAIIAAAWMELMIVMGLLMVVYEFRIEQLNPRITDLGYLAGAMLLAILPAASIQVTRQWYREREVTTRLKQEKLELELYARQIELDYLKEQIRPHFLFNILNTLYGLTLEKSDEAPEMVLNVSGMLDYMLYRSSHDRVPLDEELEQITNYIELQKLRCGERLELDVTVDPEVKSHHIAPMILLPFVENSFKHGVSKSASDSFIHITVAVRNDRLHFTVTNSRAPSTRNSSESGAGVGLKNVEKRLGLLYGNDYRLEITESEQEYGVDLDIPTTRT